MQKVLAEMCGAQMGCPCLKRSFIDIVCVEVIHVLPLTLSPNFLLVMLPGCLQGIVLIDDSTACYGYWLSRTRICGSPRQK